MRATKDSRVEGKRALGLHRQGEGLTNEVLGTAAHSSGAARRLQQGNRAGCQSGGIAWRNDEPTLLVLDDLGADTLKMVALFCGVGLAVSLICATCGLDLSPGFF